MQISPPENNSTQHADYITELSPA